MKTFADCYAKGDYPNAWLELEKHKDSISPGLWHFNAGTVKAKLSALAEARYHFLQAKLYGFQNTELNENLKVIEQQLEIKSVEEPIEFSDYAVKFGLWAQNGFFTTISLLILVCGLLALKRERKISVLILTLILMGIPLGTELWVKSWDKGVNLISQQVLEGPSAIFPSRGELPAGVFVLTRKSADWYQITYPARFRGWVKRNAIKELE